jgi:hypothetical protein
MIGVRVTLAFLATSSLFSAVGFGAPIPSRFNERSRASYASPDSVHRARITVAQCIVDAGIPKQQAVERTALLSDEDVIQLAEHADQLRAAGGLNRWQIAAIVVGGIALILLSFVASW